MESNHHPLAILLSAVVVTACGGPDLIGPSPPPRPATVPPSSLPAVYGDITLRSVSPEPGATVLARPCAEDATRLCADRPEVTIEVVVDRDLDDVMITARYDHCGFSSSPPLSLASHIPTVISLSRVDLSDDGLTHDGVGATLLCELPAITRQVKVSLWRRGEPQTPLLTRDFAGGYTFARP